MCDVVLQLCARVCVCARVCACARLRLRVRVFSPGVSVVIHVCVLLIPSPCVVCVWWRCAGAPRAFARMRVAGGCG